MRLVQTNILFRPSEIEGRVQPNGVAPAVATIFINTLDLSAFDLSEILTGSSSTLDPLDAAGNFLDAALRDDPIHSVYDLDHYTVVNKNIINFITEEEIAVQINPIFGVKFADLVRGASSPVKIATGITAGALGLSGMVSTVPLSAIAITIGGATSGIVLIGSAVVFVEWLRRKVLG
jgi:hypothetical protein